LNSKERDTIKGGNPAGVKKEYNMPIYEYQCGACGHRLELIQKMTEPPASECPACGRPALRKLVSAAGFQLKGSGWYATDFKDKGKAPAPAEAPSTPAAGGEASAKGESSGGVREPAKASGGRKEE
jgi:putative FmdB family regulatory protein